VIIVIISLSAFILGYAMAKLAERSAEKRKRRELQKAKEAGEAYWKERKQVWAENYELVRNQKAAQAAADRAWRISEGLERP